MERVCVLGPCGAGKSTLARRLGERVGLPVVHLDRVFWRAGWVMRGQDEARADLEAEVARDRWVIEGNWLSTPGGRFDLADTVVLLDYAPRVYRWRVLKRQVTGRFRGRPDIAEGCRESFDPAFMKYVWRFHVDKRPELLRRMDGMRDDQRAVVVRTPAETERWLASL
ncbi:MAG: hypothetical protein AAF288_03040 [Planctomycetota bacterium]